MAAEPTNLEDLLDRIEDTAERDDPVRVDELVEALGRGSFGPLMLLAGISVFSPLSGIPGFPTVMGVLILLVALQLLLRRRCFWLPRWLLRRSISRRRLQKAARWLRRPARAVDRHLRPRWPALVRGASLYAIASICAAVGAGMPLMELVPFSSSVAGGAVAAFGLALIARDGVAALVAYAFTFGTAAMILVQAI